jgi:triacylglycerol esterase/lipase EstA (alpha/beta hydrolase family)
MCRPIDKDKIVPSCLRSLVNIIYSLAVEFFIVLMGMFFYLFCPEDEATRQEGKRPILLVHGFMHNSSAFHYLRYRLRQAGVGQIFVLNFGNPFQSISGVFVDKLRQKVEHIARETGREDLSIIGHSMGGLVSTDFIITDKRKNIRLATLGSPLKGTYAAYIGIGPAAREMRPHSDYLMNLDRRKKEWDEKLEFLHIGSETDEIIYPKSSAYPENWGTTRSFSDLGHMTLLFSDRVADELIKWEQQPNMDLSTMSHY